MNRSPQPRRRTTFEHSALVLSIFLVPGCSDRGEDAAEALLLKNGINTRCFACEYVIDANNDGLLDYWQDHPGEAEEYIGQMGDPHIVAPGMRVTVVSRRETGSPPLVRVVLRCDGAIVHDDAPTTANERDRRVFYREYRSLEAGSYQAEFYEARKSEPACAITIKVIK